ncbi:MFS transporter, partial [Bacillus subtilis]
MTNGNGAAQRRVMAAGAIGHFVEFYDFALYGYFATTIAALFFPKSSPATALLSTFAIFAVSFFMRPVGGIVFGHLGDKIGRRAALLWSLMLMSAGTVVIGLLPGYTQIGLAAPILLLLCRMVQGFSAGGEYSSANIFMIEYAPYRMRGRYASVAPAAGAFSAMFAPMVAVAATSTTTTAQLASWGWRLPFLAAAPLALIGLYLRLRVEESPVFAELRARGNVEPAPLKQAFKIAKKPMVVLFLWVMSSAAGYYIVSTFLVSYMTQTEGF